MTSLPNQSEEEGRVLLSHTCGARDHSLAATEAEPSGQVLGLRARRLSSASTASRTNARRSSSSRRAASIRDNVPASKLISHFSGNRSVLPKIISVSRIRYVDSPNGISHIRLVSNGDPP